MIKRLIKEVHFKVRFKGRRRLQDRGPNPQMVEWSMIIMLLQFPHYGIGGGYQRK